MESLRSRNLTGQNYQLWKMQMEYYLYQKDIFLPLGGKSKQPMSMKDEEWEVLDRKALGMIRLVPGSIDGFQYFKRKDNRGFDEGIG
jgi:hypothetical protein